MLRKSHTTHKVQYWHTVTWFYLSFPLGCINSLFLLVLSGHDDIIVIMIGLLVISENDNAFWKQQMLVFRGRAGEAWVQFFSNFGKFFMKLKFSHSAIFFQNFI